MEKGLVFGSLSALFAFTAAFFLIYVATCNISAERKKAAAFQLEGSAGHSSILARRLRNGVSFLMPFARLLLRNERVCSLTKNSLCILKERGWVSSNEAMISSVLAALLVFFAGAAVVSGSLFTSLALCACVLALVIASIHTAWEKRAAAMREEVPDALRAMGVCFQAGLSLMQTLEQVATEIKGPMKALFRQGAHQLETGASASSALSNFRVSSSVPELSFVAVALDVQHQTGGSIAQVLDAARDTVESELGLERSLRVQTAQAKLSARIVTFMPFVLVAFFSLVSESFLAPFFASIAGMVLLGLALAMQVAGVLLVRRMLKVEVA